MRSLLLLDPIVDRANLYARHFQALPFRMYWVEPLLEVSEALTTHCPQIIVAHLDWIFPHAAALAAYRQQQPKLQLVVYGYRPQAAGIEQLMELGATHIIDTAVTRPHDLAQVVKQCLAYSFVH
jgi:hypothetical protein